jgi:hypothetical protein
MIYYGLGLCYLTPLSTIFQLYRGATIYNKFINVIHFIYIYISNEEVWRSNFNYMKRMNTLNFPKLSLLY